MSQERGFRMILGLLRDRAQAIMNMDPEDFPAEDRLWIPETMRRLVHNIDAAIEAADAGDAWKALQHAYGAGEVWGAWTEHPWYRAFMDAAPYAERGAAELERLAEWSRLGTEATRKATDAEIKQALDDAACSGTRKLTALDEIAARRLGIDRSRVNRRRRAMDWKPPE